MKKSYSEIKNSKLLLIQINKVKMRSSIVIDFFFHSEKSIYILLVISALIVLPNIGRESLWLDEIFSATVTLKTSSLKLMFSEYISNDGNPPLYYVLLFYWEKIVGASDVNLRLLSYLFTLLGFISSYLLLQKYFTRRIAILFLSLSTFTPCVLFFAQEARMYALLYGLTCIASIIFFVFIIRIRDNKKIERKLIVYYFCIASLICYTHHFGSLIIVLISLVTILYSLFLKRNTIAIEIFVISIFIGIIGSSWLVFQFYYVDMGVHIKEVSWLKNNIKSILLNFSTLLALNKFGVAVLLILLFPFLMKFSFFYKFLKGYIILLLPVLLLFFLAYFVALKIFVISERYLIVTIPFILLFLSFLFNELYYSKKHNILFYVIGLLIISFYGNYNYEKQNWRDAAKYIKNNFNVSNCKVPIRALKDGSFDRLMFVSYYLGSEYSYIANGPSVQNDCDLIYIDGHTNEIEIRKTLNNYNISTPYKIINFNKVYLVVKRR